MLRLLYKILWVVVDVVLCVFSICWLVGRPVWGSSGRLGGGAVSIVLSAAVGVLRSWELQVWVQALPM